MRTVKPYNSTVAYTDSDTRADLAPTHQELAHRMVVELQAERDPHKRAHARAQLIKFLTDGARIAGLSARGK